MRFGQHLTKTKTFTKADIESTFNDLQNMFNRYQELIKGYRNVS